MQESFYFYDLETSGLNPRADRIMQFAGMRTDKDFQPIGEPDNILVKLPDDTLPSPGAIMVTGITPSNTQLDGISEREFCEFFVRNVATPGTTIVGFNSVRFDDEFIRATLWRNFHDPYEWQWQDGRSRWDLLDVVRLTRALRPEGIKWPFSPEGHPTNRLELITKENNIAHEHAHDALSDVEALVSVTKLIHDRQPQLFNYLFNLRNKREVAKLVNLIAPQAFVYASGRYPSENLHTTVAYPIAEAPNGNILVFDLRYNLDELLEKEKEASGGAKGDSAELAKAGVKEMAESNGASEEKLARRRFSELEPWEKGYFPIVKKMQFNHCPAVAPLGVLEKDDGWKKIQFSRDEMQKNLDSLLGHPEFIERMAKAAKPDTCKSDDPESALYDGFLNDKDRRLCAVVRGNEADDLADFYPPFDDERLQELLLHYKAKNFPEALTAEEAEKWQAYRHARLNRQAPRFLSELEKIKAQLGRGEPYGSRSLADCEFLAEELMLWYQSLQ